MIADGSNGGMSGRVARPPVLAGTPELIFRWRPLRQAYLPKLLNLAVVGGAFALLITTVRIQVKVPEKSVPRKAGLIYLRDDVESQILARRAREGGPFPSRFEPSQWPGLAEVEAAAMNAAQFQPPAYAPVVPDLPPESLAKPIPLAPRGEAFFPPRTVVRTTPPEAGNLRLAPALYPLSGITEADFPDKLPEFGVADKDVSRTPWRFLVKLGPGGAVEECVSLEKGNEKGADALENWLQALQFKAAPGKPDRWAALGISFTNQPKVPEGPKSDGTDPR